MTVALIVFLAMIGSWHVGIWTCHTVDRLVDHLWGREQPRLPPATVRAIRRARKRLRAQLPSERILLNHNR